MSRLNLTISRVLVVGLILSIAFLLVGAVLSLARPELSAVHETSVRDIPRAIWALEPAGFFSLGLLLLLATPAARVVALLVGFTRRKMWLFSFISLIVLAGLAASAVVGLLT
jgi:uncharacterized membrane protein